ncbi:MAG: ABC transporter ATP-binding protein [Spirochaetes bacterium GWF1_31_7]|nr:MAG: ABC transporter ATP-binding protein [Spirochaetes bacterium GWE1_32_154]OHD49156.1 MAG: ABC transporter ATP-binding protein [Spirochaetes bacterium GWF1_31_7]OHD50259.1 MAG: ABC transporter ATP-binding protein [Spirochaetes bacterium GWE2_31_10]OHD76601.1 MAG: ABC transporter ATP-binding protein [Spirochaetes bacterium RIFOXYB1_FULL_32_8]HBD93958.1 ABC transporter ATP-binding protein [Spirochaetia bacterium]
METIIQLKQIKKTYSLTESVSVQALRGVDIEIKKGDFIAVMGPSGSGKSTLMNILGCLDIPTDGEYFLDGVSVKTLNKDELAGLRNEKLGFVFQGFNLLSRTTALENVELPLFYNRTHDRKDFKALSIAALERVGLGNRLDHTPNMLSGGQQQRVAIARSLVNTPKVLLADEPTGNLDTATSLDIMSIFQELNDQGITLVLVTHEPDIAQFAKRVITVRDGMIREDYQVKNRKSATEEIERFKAGNIQIFTESEKLHQEVV